MPRRNMNSILPLGIPGANAINRLRVNVENFNNKVNDTLTNTYNAFAKKTSNALENASDAVSDVANSAAQAIPFASNVAGNAVNAGTPANSSKTIMSLGVFAALVFAFLLLFTYYRTEITESLNALWTMIRESLGLQTAPPDALELGKVPGQEVLKPSVPPQDDKPSSSSIAEKVLPAGGAGPEVFNISKNTFTYYDAEPLCKALGAQLATYDQVKEAWEKGADWCNYGWVKGQNAVYPTQEGTWEKLQSGPEEDRMSCGRPGINGGYFDNPELRFGVNCYGPKPAQSKHDEATIAKRNGQPLTPAGIEFEKKVSKYRGEADNIGLLPFNESKWASN